MPAPPIVRCKVALHCTSGVEQHHVIGPHAMQTGYDWGTPDFFETGPITDITDLEDWMGHGSSLSMVGKLTVLD